MYNKRKLDGIGERIRTSRERQNLTLEALGEKIGCGKSSISKIENNKQSPAIEQIADIANALNVDIEYILGIDKEACFISNFIKSFKRITTAKEYHTNNGGIFNKEDFVFEIDEDYLVLTGNKNLFTLIKEIARIQNLQPKLSKNDYLGMLKTAKQNFKQNKENCEEDKYFLISGEQMSEIIELAIRNQTYTETLLKEIGVITPLEGKPLPTLKLNRKNKNDQK